MHTFLARLVWDDSHPQLLGLVTTTQSKRNTEKKLARLWAKFMREEHSESFVEWLPFQGVNVQPVEILDVNGEADEDEE